VTSYGGRPNPSPGLFTPAISLEGTRRRIDAARKFVKEFGIATECGIGARLDPPPY